MMRSMKAKNDEKWMTWWENFLLLSIFHDNIGKFLFLFFCFFSLLVTTFHSIFGKLLTRCWLMLKHLKAKNIKWWRWKCWKDEIQFPCQNSLSINLSTFFLLLSSSYFCHLFLYCWNLLWEKILNLFSHRISPFTGSRLSKVFKTKTRNCCHCKFTLTNFHEQSEKSIM